MPVCAVLPVLDIWIRAEPKGGNRIACESGSGRDSAGCIAVPPPNQRADARQKNRCDGEQGFQRLRHSPRRACAVVPFALPAKVSVFQNMAPAQRPEPRPRLSEKDQVLGCDSPASGLIDPRKEARAITEEQSSVLSQLVRRELQVIAGARFRGGRLAWREFAVGRYGIPADNQRRDLGDRSRRPRSRPRRRR